MDVWSDNEGQYRNEYVRENLLVVTIEEKNLRMHIWKWFLKVTLFMKFNPVLSIIQSSIKLG